MIAVVVLQTQVRASFGTVIVGGNVESVAKRTDRGERERHQAVYLVLRCSCEEDKVVISICCGTTSSLLPRRLVTRERTGAWLVSCGRTWRSQ